MLTRIKTVTAAEINPGDIIEIQGGKILFVSQAVLDPQLDYMHLMDSIGWKYALGASSACYVLEEV